MPKSFVFILPIAIVVAVFNVFMAFVFFAFGVNELLCSLVLVAIDIAAAKFLAVSARSWGHAK